MAASSETRHREGASNVSEVGEHQDADAQRFLTQFYDIY